MFLWRIRYFQIKRDLGFLFLPILVLTAFVFYFLFYHSTLPAHYIPLFVIAIVLTIHQNRKDLTFLYKHIDNPYWQIISEYQLMILPITLASLMGKHWAYFFILHSAIFFIPIFKFTIKEKLRFVFLGKIISGFHFEWISGLRKNSILLIVLYTICLALSFVKIVPIFGLFLVGAFIQSFYKENESIQMLQSSGLNSKSFLNKKIKFALTATLIINVPVLLINSIFQPDMIPLNLFFGIYQCLVIATVIVLKYNYYLPKTSSNRQMIQLAIINIGLFQPYLIPVTFFIFIQQYKLSKQNLSIYLND